MCTLIDKVRSGVCRLVSQTLLDLKWVDSHQMDAAIEEQNDTNELIGQILVRRGLINQDQLVEILDLHLTGQQPRTEQQVRKQLGEILLERSHISRWQLSTALEKQGLGKQKVGQILIDLGYTSRGKVEEALSHQVTLANHDPAHQRKTMGQLLLEVGHLTAEQLDEALEEQKRTNAYLGNILLERGFISHDELDDLLATQIIVNHEGRETPSRLGDILLHTRQISNEQLELAVEIQTYCKRKLGDILVDLGYVPLMEMTRALRLQKRLATLSMVTVLGSMLLTGCGTPTVPLQMAPTANMAIAQVQNGALQMQQPSSAAVAGPFKILEVDNGQSLKVFQNGSKVIDGVPFMRQGSDNTCGQAVMTSLLNYWGVKMDYQKVVNEANPRNLATTGDAITSYLRSKGLKAQDFRNGTVDNLIAQVNKGRPVPVMLDFGGLSQEHYVLVVGYNKKKGTIIMHDSLEGPYLEMETPTFQQMWKNKSIVNVPVFGGDNYKNIMFDVYK